MPLPRGSLCPCSARRPWSTSLNSGAKVREKLCTRCVGGRKWRWLFIPATPQLFFFFSWSEAPASELSSPKRKVGRQPSKTKAGWGGAGRGRAAPGFLSILMFHFPRLLVRQTHGTGRNGGEGRMGRSTPWPLAHPQRRAGGGGSSQEQR